MSSTFMSPHMQLPKSNVVPLNGSIPEIYEPTYPQTLLLLFYDLLVV